MSKIYSDPMTSSRPDEGGLYVHVPFCNRKCIYCDFYSAGVAKANWDRYVDALIGELETRTDELPERLCSIYIGGGTPSLLPPRYLHRLLSAIEEKSDISRCREITLEINPENVDKKMAQEWKSLGINRFSMGVQTFDDAELKTLGRSHNAAMAITSAQILREYTDNLSLDMIFGIPGQTISSLKASLKQLLAISPDHISLYCLMYEPGTALTILRDNGRIKEQEEEISIEMYHLIHSVLNGYGFEQYEISNYALPGKRSVHNSSYWNFRPYLGIGPSAHSYDGHSRRRGNPADLYGWLKYYNFKTKEEVTDRGFYVEEILSAEQRLEEMVMLRLRTKEGLDLTDVQEQFGEQIFQRLVNKAQDWKKEGKILIEGQRVSLTQEGIMLINEIILSMI